LPAELLKIDCHQPEMSLVRYAANRIRAGEVVGIPTDTFYGLAADPMNLLAVERIYEIKGRSRHKPLSLLIESVEQGEDLARDVPEEFYMLANKYWPGPLTLIVRAGSRLPLKVTANTGNVALRLPAAEIPVAVVRAVGFPVTATSASLAGSTDFTTAEGMSTQMGSRIGMIVNGGPTPRDVPTTIVDLSQGQNGWQIIREGAISAQEISELLSSDGR
jgi:tRNA threonylcarbamoyl adenosine modification protein (Sua5/YciO/YrdC/YwlC family)